MLTQQIDENFQLNIEFDCFHCDETVDAQADAMYDRFSDTTYWEHTCPHCKHVNDGNLNYEDGHAQADTIAEMAV